MIEIYIHLAERRDPELVKFEAEAIVEDILKHVSPQDHEQLLLIIQGEEEPRERHHKVRDCGIGHRHHVHVHRCRKIAVTVFYNEDKTEHVSPATTVENVLIWALNAFGLKGADRLDKGLRLPSDPKNFLPDAAHIGSFASHKDCSVRLDLTAKVGVQG